MSASQSAPAIDARALETASDTHIFDNKGEKVRFGDVFANQKTVVVFVRAYCAVTRAHIHVDIVVCLKGISSVGYDAASPPVAVLLSLTIYHCGGSELLGVLSLRS
jgi:hypothetical protein